MRAAGRATFGSTCGDVPVTERELTRAVLELAARLGYRTAHFRTSLTKRGTYMTAVQGDGAGFPDLVLVRRGRLVFAELKKDGRYPTGAQRDWLDALSGCGVEAHVWREKDWPDVIAGVLA